MCPVGPHALCEAQDQTALHLWCVLKVSESGTRLGKSLEFSRCQTSLTAQRLSHLIQMLPCFGL